MTEQTAKQFVHGIVDATHKAVGVRTLKEIEDEIAEVEEHLNRPMDGDHELMLQDQLRKLREERNVFHAAGRV